MSLYVKDNIIQQDEDIVMHILRGLPVKKVNKMNLAQVKFVVYKVNTNAKLLIKILILLTAS